MSLRETIWCWIAVTIGRLGTLFSLLVLNIIIIARSTSLSRLLDPMRVGKKDKSAHG